MVTYRTADENHGANIMRNGRDGDYMAFALQNDGQGGMEFWYTVGSSYKTEQNAIKYAARSLAKHGYELIAE